MNEMKKFVEKCFISMLALALSVHAVADSGRQEVTSLLPTSSVNIGKYEFNIKNGADERICRDFVASLKNTQPEEAALACSVDFDPSMKQFGFPDWKGIGNKEYWDIAYDVEQRISYFFLSHKEATKEEWLEDYTQKIRSGEYKPRLRQARAKLADGAPWLTVFGYTRYGNNIDGCKKAVKKNAPWGAKPGELVYIYDKSRNTLVEIIPSLDSEIFFKNRTEHHVFTYYSNLYFLESQPAADGYDILIYGIDMQVAPAEAGKNLYTFFAKQSCNISASNVSIATQ